MPEYNLSDLIDVEKFQDLMDLFYKVSGAPIGIVDTNHNVLVATGWQDICTEFHRKNKNTLTRCYESDTYIANHIDENKPVLYKCKNGLSDVAIPIVIEDKLLATIFFGQFFYDDEKPDIAFFEAQADKYGFDKKEYLESLGRIPHFSKSFVDSVLKMYTSLAKILVDQGLQNLQLKREIDKNIQTYKAFTNSELHYKILLENAADAVYVSSMDGNILEVNSIASQQTGYAAEELKAMTIFDLDSKSKTDNHRDTLWANFQIGTPITITSEHKRKNGSSFPVEVRMSLVDINGEKKIFGLARDLTDRTKDKIELQESEEKFRKLTEASPTAVMIYQDGKWVYTNAAGCEISGYSEEELLTMDFFDFVHPDFKEMIIEKGEKRQIGKNTDIERYEFKIITKQGVEKWVLLSGATTTFQHKSAAIISVMDITDRKNTEFELRNKNEEIARQNEEYVAVNEELNQTLEVLKQMNIELGQAKDQAEESDKLKSAFLANMSHEIRTPMNAILGFSRLLGTDKLTPQQESKYINQINLSGDQLLRIINDIIDISKIEANLLKIDLQPVHITELLTSVTDLKINPYNHPVKKNVSLHLIVPDKLSNLVVDSDQTRLTQILNNLINNAAKYTDEGFIEVGLKEISRNDKNLLEFYVKDSGRGISTENQQKIFNHFIQVAPGGFTEGNGLGLSITKGLVDLLGGKMSLKSKLGEGSVFSFTLPYQKILSENPDREIHAEPITSTHKGKLLYLAEDDPTSAYLIHEMLNNTGIEIIDAPNGKVLLDLIKNKVPDLVILDINMPIMNGYEAIEVIRKEHINLPVIAQTAYAMPDEKERILKAGCSDYISKPIDIHELLKLIGKALR